MFLHFILINSIFFFSLIAQFRLRNSTPWQFVQPEYTFRESGLYSNIRGYPNNAINMH